MIINKYSFRYKLANKIAQLFLDERTPSYFFSTKERASCLIKIVFKHQGKILVAKKVQLDSLAKICLPYGYVDLANYEDNISTCIKIAYDKMNLELETIDFEQAKLIDVKLDYEDDISQVVYVYEYTLEDREFAQISDSYSFYDFFLLDLNEINEYKKKKRFVTDLDYVILKKLNKG